jgi:hypothetical protein
LELQKIVENMSFIRDSFEEVSLKSFDLKRIGELAFKYYWDYNCEYGLITAFNQEAGLNLDYQQVRAFTPLLPHRWSRVCGAITGAFWVFALTLEPSEFKTAAQGLIEFHNKTPLPVFRAPKTPKLPKAPALSILCRDSIVNWCKATGVHPRSMERSYRCAAITADVAVKCGQIVRELSPVV